ncbi:MAG TPA: MFS transporter [Candidatus Limnocylindrales bacterium]|nr:MFS transporter [Candidatus Limnocylindrales bacterium]
MTFAPRAILDLEGMRAFRHRNYRLFFLGQGTSLIGTWMQSVAQSWLVLLLTGDPFVLGVVAAFQFLPVLVLGLFGGVIADHLPKRRTLMATQTFAMFVSFVMFLLTWTNTVQVWHVLGIALLIGLRNAVDMPTRQAFSVEMVGRDDIQNAVALNSATFNGARIIGPAVAGLVIGAFGVPLAFLIDALSFLAVLVALWAMDEHELQLPPTLPRPHSVGEVAANLREGLVYVRDTRLVLLAISVIGLVSTFGMNFTVLVPPLAKDVLHSDAAGYGFLMAASGLGSLTAAIAIAFGGRASAATIVGGAILLGLAEVVTGVSNVFGLTLVAMVFVGVGGIAMSANANSVIQLSVPDVLRGRVLSVYTTVFAGSTPIGGLVMGGIAGSMGVPTALAVGGAISALVGFVGWLSVRSGFVPAAPPKAAPRRASPDVSSGPSVLPPPAVRPAVVRGPVGAATATARHRDADRGPVRVGAVDRERDTEVSATRS